MDFSQINNIFFDLDGTLLPMDEDQFARAYFSLVANYFSNELSQQEFIKYLLEGTNAMLVHHDPKKPVLESFFDSFTKNTGITRETAYERFDKFYRSDFKKVKTIIDDGSISKQIIDLAKEKNIKLILATNPIFPEIATQERLSWVNLNLSDFEYVSHAENSFYCKPNPKYYENILNITGVNPNNSLMVGNDYLYDMSAKTVGIKTWLIDKYLGNEEYKTKYEIDYKGSLKYLLDQLQDL